MARLTDTEKKQLLQAVVLDKRPRPSCPRLSIKEYLAQVSFAAYFVRREKPVNFKGQHWKL